MTPRRDLPPIFAALFLSFHAQAADALRTGISTNYKPLAFKENRQIPGVEADLAAALNQRMGRDMNRWIKIKVDVE